jgi:hypothetical protein
MTASETFTSLRSTLDQGAPSRHEVDGGNRRVSGSFAPFGGSQYLGMIGSAGAARPDLV